ncbi:hypothetical protein [Pseudomonas purpurea]|uniref:hypothetical protein n=1 Tax=Pseudomonas purpurea TaxID=3136737 RepID=UPI0032664A1D
MNAATNPPINYGLAAFNSGAVPAQPPHKWPEDANRSGWMRTVLHWGHYANREPWQDVNVQLQAKVVDVADSATCNDIYINHQRWRFENFNKILLLLIFLKWTSLAFIPWFIWSMVLADPLGSFVDRLLEAYGKNLGVYALMLMSLVSVAMIGLSIWFTGQKEPNIKYYLIQTGIGVTLCLIASIADYGNPAHGNIHFIGTAAMAITVFMGVIGWDYVTGLYFRVFVHDGSEFNRQTGMLTVAHRFRTPFTAPFYEFDTTMEFRPGPHGSSCMAIWLHHRYSDFEVFLGAKVQSLGMNREECLAFWDTLQRYMDVSQPLPELPILEQFRHLDPTTAAHDKLTKRPPRRWRDLKYQVWERTERSAMMKGNLKYQWQNQPCILRARIDPTLSIETYYRTQEAKGIHSTPKADDYDNVHRG